MRCWPEKYWGCGPKAGAKGAKEIFLLNFYILRMMLVIRHMLLLLLLSLFIYLIPIKAQGLGKTVYFKKQNQPNTNNKKTTTRKSQGCKIEVLF